MTREEVIKALECCILRDPDDKSRCGKCPYPSGSACLNRLKMDALALLKSDQERGRWIEETDRERHWHCSVCGYVAGIAGLTYKYCPECGAKMGDDDNAD